MPRVKVCRAPGCHTLVTKDSRYCPTHISLDVKYERDNNYLKRYNKVVRNRDESKSSQYNFYRTRQWVHLRQQVLSNQNYLCQYCLLSGVVKPAKIVDHIVPIEFDATKQSDLNNLVVVCSACHTAKTKWEQRYYGTGAGNELKQVNPICKIDAVKVLMQHV